MASAMAEIDDLANQVGDLSIKDYLERFTPDVVRRLFDAMKEYGERRLKEETKHTKGRTDQFVLVLVLSEGEIRDQWSCARVEEFAADKLKAKRFAFLKNTADHDIDGFKDLPGRPVMKKNEEGEKYWEPKEHHLHGEKYFLEKLQKGMLHEFKESSKERPVFVMYTHYIPCAKISGTSYSCSEDLAEVFKPGSECSLLVAFTAYFEGTNAHKALNFLKKRAIVPFQKLFDGTYGTFHPVNPADVQALNFQSEVYQCLMNHPISHCAGDEENTKKVVAFFVNLLTYSYTSQYEKKRGEIKDTERSYKSTLSMETGKLIDDNLKDDCTFCSQKNPQTLAAAKDTVKFCVFRSLQVVGYFGQPTSQEAVFENTWVQYQGKWKDIYSQSPVVHKEGAPGGVCAKWTKSVESLCRALTASASGPSTSQQSYNAKLRERSSTELQPTPQRSEEATPKSQQSDEAEPTSQQSDEAQATLERSDEDESTSERSDEDESTSERSDEDESTSERSDEDEINDPFKELSLRPKQPDNAEPTPQESDADKPSCEKLENVLSAN